MDYFHLYFVVLVPFDIGVVYIKEDVIVGGFESFSPLRYWGSLYLFVCPYKPHIYVLVPFDIGVVYIRNELTVFENEKF